MSLENDVQVVRMTAGIFRYSPNKFTLERCSCQMDCDIKDIYSCASSIVSQELGIRKGLELGEDIFEFTPVKTGTIRFSCVMGMYSGSFAVVDEILPAAVPSGSPGQIQPKEQIPAHRLAVQVVEDADAEAEKQKRKISIK